MIKKTTLLITGLVALTGVTSYAIAAKTGGQADPGYHHVLNSVSTQGNSDPYTLTSSNGCTTITPPSPIKASATQPNTTNRIIAKPNAGLPGLECKATYTRPTTEAFCKMTLKVNKKGELKFKKISKGCTQQGDDIVLNGSS